MRHKSAERQKESKAQRSSDARGRRLLLVIIITLSIAVVQIIGGFLSNSLALFSDALHSVGDSSALIIAFLAGRLSLKAADSLRTFGYKRVEILAALFNGALLIGICLFLLHQAYGRFISPEPVKGGLMMIVAAFGLLANVTSAFILHGFRASNLNIKAAYLHVLGDALVSITVLIGGFSIFIFNIFWLDPLITVLVAIYIIFQTLRIIRQTTDILMHTVPQGIDLDSLRQRVETVDGVENIHHIHIWRHDDRQILMEAHLNLTHNMSVTDMMRIQHEVEEILETDFGIQHVTIQVGYNCCEGSSDLIAGG